MSVKRKLEKAADDIDLDVHADKIIKAVERYVKICPSVERDFEIRLKALERNCVVRSEILKQNDKEKVGWPMTDIKRLYKQIEELKEKNEALEKTNETLAKRLDHVDNMQKLFDENQRLILRRLSTFEKMVDRRVVRSDTARAMIRDGLSVHKLQIEDKIKEDLEKSHQENEGMKEQLVILFNKSVSELLDDSKIDDLARRVFQRTMHCDNL